MDNFHTPVLKDEVIEGLNVKRDRWYIDATIGGGGHTSEILKLGGKVLGIDRDDSAHLHLKKKFESEIEKGNLILAKGNFSEIKEITERLGITEIDGMLFDLGVSSFQIDKSERGFSFIRDEALDMRMGGSVVTAEEIINSWSEDDLYAMFAKYGEEPRASEVAHEIVFRRKLERITTTGQLTKIITEVIRGSGKIHPATRIFQALRIVVNDEINSLKIGISEGFKLLDKGGRMEVISFHSLEDRAVKLFFIDLGRKNLGKIITKKPIIAEFSEIKQNRRSRSAKMRIIEKI